MDKPRGKVVVFSGPSGVGKGTVLDRLLADCPLPLRLAVSATTRPRRPNEEAGVAYHFLSEREFFRRMDAGEFIEACEVFGSGHWYGTLVSEVATGVARGEWVILEIDIAGAKKAVEVYPDAVTVFLRPPSLEELRRRLVDRGTEDAAAVNRRLEVARTELAESGWYRHQVVNEDPATAAVEICEILNRYV